ncbi:MAG: hypothetical protein GY782_08710 [Gammaproteobacteria bacterium]|nr:hypothetical protein [Gammaproteobacteria bacterium]
MAQNRRNRLSPHEIAKNAELLKQYGYISALVNELGDYFIRHNITLGNLLTKPGQNERKTLKECVSRYQADRSQNLDQLLVSWREGLYHAEYRDDGRNRQFYDENNKLGILDGDPCAQATQRDIDTVLKNMAANSEDIIFLDDAASPDNKFRAGCKKYFFPSKQMGKRGDVSAITDDLVKRLDASDCLPGDYVITGCTNKNYSHWNGLKLVLHKDENGTRVKKEKKFEPLQDGKQRQRNDAVTCGHECTKFALTEQGVDSALTRNDATSTTQSLTEAMWEDLKLDVEECRMLQGAMAEPQTTTAKMGRILNKSTSSAKLVDSVVNKINHDITEACKDVQAQQKENGLSDQGANLLFSQKFDEIAKGIFSATNEGGMGASKAGYNNSIRWFGQKFDEISTKNTFSAANKAGMDMDANANANQEDCNIICQPS